MTAGPNPQRRHGRGWRPLLRILAPALQTLLLAAPVGAAEFARSRLIEPVDDNLVQRLVVPADVYAWTVRNDLGDLRVVNGAGDVVPHALGQGAAEAAYSDWQSLPLFALPRAADGGAPGTRVDIELGDDGTVVAVRGGQGAERTQGNWLLDASDATRALSELNLYWAENTGDVVARLRVEASADLDRWRELVRSATVADLTTDGQRVIARRVELPPTEARYLRLTHLDAGVLDLTRVEARSRLPSQPDRAWLALPAAANRDGDEFEFDSGGHYPIDRVSVEIPRPTFLVEAELWSREESDRPWQARGRHRFYRVAVPDAPAGTAPLTSDPVAATADRYWRLRWRDDTSLPPILRIGWLPHELWFLRQGPGPYRVLYGRADTDAQPWPVRDLAERLGAGTTLAGLPAAALGEPETLGGRASLEAPPQPVDWRSVLLWSVLLSGVGLVIWLAVRVLR